jgi:hypothetical protein
MSQFLPAFWIRDSCIYLIFSVCRETILYRFMRLKKMNILRLLGAGRFTKKVTIVGSREMANSVVGNNPMLKKTMSEAS